jgi:hypothetical protein
LVGMGSDLISFLAWKFAWYSSYLGDL